MLIFLEALIEDELNRKWEAVDVEYNGPLTVERRSVDDEFAGLIVKHETYPEFAISYASHLGGRHQTDSILAYVDTDYTLDIIDDERYYEELCKFVAKFRDEIETVGRILNMATDRIRVL